MSENIGRYNVIFEIKTKMQNDGLNKVTKKASGLQRTFNLAKGAFAGIIAANVVQGAISQIGRLGASTITLAGQAEQTRESFATMLGSMEEAKDLIKELDTFSLKTPFEPTEIQNAAKTLLGFGRASKDVIKDLEIVGNAAASTGGDIQSISRTYAKIYGLGKLQGEEANSFIDQGLPVYDLLSQSLNKSVGEIKKLQGEGKITFDILKKSFEDASKEGGKFYNGLVKQSKTFNGLMSTLQGAAKEGLKKIGEAILPLLKEILPPLIDMTFKFVNWMSEASKPIQKVTKSIFHFGKTIIDAVYSAIKPLIDGLSDALSGIYKYYSAFSKGQKKTRAFTLVLEFLARTLKVVSRVIGGVLSAIGNLYSELSETKFIKPFIVGVQAVIFGLSKIPNVLNGIVESIVFMGTSFSDQFKNMGYDLSIFYGEAKSFFGLLDAEGEKQLKQNKERQYILEQQIKRNGNIIDAFKKGYGAIDLEPTIEFGEIKDETSKSKKSTNNKNKTQDKKSTADLEKRLEREIALIEIAYAKKAIRARAEIKDIEARNLKLEEIELKKLNKIARLKQSYEQSESSNFYKYETEVLSRNEKLNKVLAEQRQTHLDKIRSLNKSNLAKELEELSGYYQAFANLGQSGEISKSLGDEFGKIAGFLKDVNGSLKSLDEERIENLSSQIDKMLAGLEKKAKEASKKGKNKPFLQDLLGLNDEDYEEVKASIDKAVEYSKQAFNAIFEHEKQKIEERISLQEDRVSKAKELAEKGRTDQLVIEEDRLKKLQEKREKFVKAQQAIDQAQILSANAVAAAESIRAIVSSFRDGGVVGIATGIATSIALAAQIALIVSTVNSSFADIPAFRHGIEAFGAKKDGLVTGKGNGTSDSNLAWLSKYERVVPEVVNREIGYDFPNNKLADAVKLYKTYPHLQLSHSKIKKEDDKIISEMKELRSAFESLKIQTNFNEKGFQQYIEKQVDGIIRRRKYIG